MRAATGYLFEARKDDAVLCQQLLLFLRQLSTCWHVYSQELLKAVKEALNYLSGKSETLHFFFPEECPPILPYKLLDPSVPHPEGDNFITFIDLVERDGVFFKKRGGVLVIGDVLPLVRVIGNSASTSPSD